MSRCVDRGANEESREFRRINVHEQQKNVTFFPFSQLVTPNCVLFALSSTKSLRCDDKGRRIPLPHFKSASNCRNFLVPRLARVQY